MRPDHLSFIDVPRGPERIPQPWSVRPLAHGLGRAERRRILLKCRRAARRVDLDSMRGVCAADEGKRISPTCAGFKETINRVAQVRADDKEYSMDNYTGAAAAMGPEVSDQAQRTADAAAEAFDGAKSTARAALETGRVYATGAVNAAGKTFEDAKTHVNRLSDQTTRYVVDQPLRAVGIAAAAGFLAAVLVNGLRSRS